MSSLDAAEHADDTHAQQHPEKRKRGRPAKGITQPLSTKRQEMLPMNTTPSDDSSSEVDDDEDKVMDVFHGGPRALTVSSIERPDFGDEKHMWFQTTQVSHMATLFKCLTKLLTSANVVFAPRGWRIMSMNSKKTVLIYLRVTEQTMEEGIYECNYNYRIRVPVDDLAARIRMFRRSEVMAMSLRGTQCEDIRLDFAAGPRVSDMNLRLRQSDDVHIDVPQRVYHTQVDLPAEEFREVVNSVKSDTLVTDITFTKHPRKFTITVETINGTINTHFLPDNSPDSVRFMQSRNDAQEMVELANNDVAAGQTLKATFALAEIIAFTEVTRAAKWVSINMPETGGKGAEVLKMSYSLAALGEISFYMSRKVDDEDEDYAVRAEDE